MPEKRQTTLVIPNEKPISWNKMYSGLHWSARKTEVDRVHILVRSVIDENSVMFTNPVKITVTSFFKNKRVQLDCSNICSKMYEDGLIGWIIKDDDPEHVVSMTTISKLDRKNPRVEIKIEEV